MFCICTDSAPSKLRGLALSVSLSLLLVHIHSLVNARGYYKEFDQEVLCDGSSGRQEQTDAREVPEVGGCKVQYAQEWRGRGGKGMGSERRGGRGEKGKGGEGRGGRGKEGRADMDHINCIE